MQPFYEEFPQDHAEIGLDESGKGSLFGRVYAAAVVLPRDPSKFDFTKMRDSKKIHSKKKMRELANYIKTNAIAWSIHYVENDDIDRVNILQADMNAMHKCIHFILEESSHISPKMASLIIDGNYFRPFCLYDKDADNGRGGMLTIPHVTIEQGDAKYASISAASILAKDARDQYILDLCEEYPELKTRYSLEKNMGYGTKAHIEGIRQYGITSWHRRTFGICKTSPIHHITKQLSSFDQTPI